MNPEFQMQEVVDWLKSIIQRGDDLVTTQTPLLVQEYLNLYFFHSLLFTAISLLTAVIVVVAGRRLSRTSSHPGDKSFCLVVSSVICGMALIFSTVSAYHAAKVKIAPRVVIVEKISDLLNPPDQR